MSSAEKSPIGLRGDAGLCRREIRQSGVQLFNTFGTAIPRKDRPGQDIAYVEYLFLKKYLLDGSPNLDGIAALILANPHRRLYQEYRHDTIDAITSLPPAMLVNLYSAPDRFAVLKPDHPLVSTACGQSIFNKAGRRLFPAEAMEERKHHTVDTNENRFMKHLLQSVQRRLHGLAKTLVGKGDGYLNPDIEHLWKNGKRTRAFFNNF